MTSLTPEIVPLPTWAWPFVAVFVVSVAWASIGNLLLFSRLYTERRIGFFLGGLAVFVYFRNRPSLKTKALDFLGLSTLIAICLSIVSCIALQPVL